MADKKFFPPTPASGDGVYTKDPEAMQNQVMRSMNPQVENTYTQVGISAPVMSKDQRKTGQISQAADAQLKSFGYTPNM